MCGMDGADIVLQHYPAAVRKMRVAMVTETYPPEINGVAMTMGRIVTGLQGRGHTVQLIRPRQHAGDCAAAQPLFEEILQRGVPIPRYDALKLGLPAKQALLRLWAMQRPDVVHVVTEGPLGWSALAAAGKLKLPIATDFHTNFHSYTAHYGVGWLKKPITAYLRKFHNKALRTLVPTDSLRLELAALGFDNLQVVARGVDTALFNPARRSPELRASWQAYGEDPVALYVGRLAPEKNLDLVLRSYQAMRTVQPGLRLVLVGDGPERMRLQRENPQVIFAGMRIGEELAAHYASADFFIFPSVTETYGNVTVEAMASGLAVIAYDYASAQQHIRHARNGVLVPFGAADEFVLLATALAEGPDRARVLGRNARATTEKLDWSFIVAEFEQALLDLTGAAFDPVTRSHAVA
ncbi:MAG: glycosyltransferase family 1 protein [Betaproteobacteria bacterium]|nr:MAG: glycosyltransferase family 1 protein [Betaproteobacteria bacterium]